MSSYRLHPARSSRFLSAATEHIKNIATFCSGSWEKLQKPVLLVRETNPRNRAGGGPAKASSRGGAAAVNFATDRRNLQSAAKEVASARRKLIFAYFLAACKK
jgi:hypothetical protein